MFHTWIPALIAGALPLGAAFVMPQWTTLAIAVGLAINLIKLGRFTGRVEERLSGVERRLELLETRRLQ